MLLERHKLQELAVTPVWEPSTLWIHSIREYRHIIFGWCINVHCEGSIFPVINVQMRRKTRIMLFLIDNYFICRNVRITNDVNWTSCYCMFGISLLHSDSSE